MIDQGGAATGLEGITWAGRTQVSLYGVRLGLRVAELDHLRALAPHFPFGATPVGEPEVDRLYSLVGRAGAAGPSYDLFVGSRRLARRRALEPLARAFASDARLFVATEAHERIFLHAGAVALHDQAILLPGRSFAGKSTLVAALVRAGATYYSDEYAVLDPQGRVQPFAKPLSIRSGAGQLSTLVDVTALGGVAGDHAIRLGAVIATRYVPGGLWQPERLSTGEATLQLLDNAVAARSRFTEVTTTVSAAVADGVRAWQGERGEADEVADWIVEELADGP